MGTRQSAKVSEVNLLLAEIWDCSPKTKTTAVLDFIRWREQSHTGLKKLFG